jgi:CheY-like chemotaxis protein
MSSGNTILVVEDDLDVADGMVSLLEEEGYRVVSAPDGAEALERLREDRGVGLVLLDLTMPNMSAGEFRTEQKKDPAIAEVPVLLMSAGLDGPQKAGVLGAVGYLGKPFKPAQLIEAVARFLRPGLASSAAPAR